MSSLGRSAALVARTLAVLCLCGCSLEASRLTRSPAPARPHASPATSAPGGYAFAFRAESAHARNHEQGLATRVGSDGVAFSSSAPGAEARAIGLRLARFGRGDALAEVGPGELRSRATRAEIARPELDLVEWYVNEERGVEQGFTLGRAPAGDAELVLELAVDGGKAGLVSPGAGTVSLRTDDGRLALHYGELVAFDATGRELPARMGAARERIELRVDDRGAIYPIVIDPLTVIESWSVVGALAGDRLGASVATAGDVNCDGFSDTVLGIPDSDADANDGGQVVVYYGSPTGPSAIAPSWSVSGEAAGMHLGAAVASAGDLDDDGCDDLAIGAPDGAGGQHVRVYRGSATTGLPLTPSWSATGFPGAAPLFEGRFGAALAAGDVNGDGIYDLVVGQPGATDGQDDEGALLVWLGQTDFFTRPLGTAANADWVATSDSAGARLGAAVASAGDANGDGRDEILAGAPLEMGKGAAYLWNGSPTLGTDPDGTPASAAWSYAEVQPDARFGASVAIVGDMQRDGYAEIAVGAPDFDQGSSIDAGEALIFLGSAAGPSVTPSWIFLDGGIPGGHTGTAVTAAGDMTGDGDADIAISSPGAPFGPLRIGRVDLILGGISIPAPPAVLGSDLTYTAPGTINPSGDAEFGFALASAGDVNGDGFGDMVVGAPDFTASHTGRAYVYLGAGGNMSPFGPFHVELGGQAGQGFGAAATIADVNGDGFGDPIHGSPLWDGAGGADVGRIDMVYGGPCWPNCLVPTPPAGAHQGTQSGERFGAALANAGDVNGDGYVDVIVGAPDYAGAAGAGEGRAFVYLGAAGGIAFTPSWEVHGGQAGSHFAQAVTGIGDMNGDGYSDVAVGAPDYSDSFAGEGRVAVYLGGLAGLATTPVWTAVGGQEGASLGAALDSAGDVNGDGVDDLIVGAPNASQGQSGEGRAFLWYGTPALGAAPVGTPANAAWSTEGDVIDAHLGAAVLGAGDMNGDTFSEVAVASAGDGVTTVPGLDHLHVFRGSAAGLTAFGAEFDRVVLALAAAGDIDGDGFGDIVVGFGPGSSPVYGGAAGIDPRYDWFLQWCDLGVRCVPAYALGGHGDANGDGFGDMLFCNPNDAGGRSETHYGNVPRGRHRAPRQLQATGEPIAVPGVSSSTAFRLGMVGRIPAGRGRVGLEWEIKPRSVPFDGTGLERSAGWVDTGAPVSPFGSTVLFDAPASFPPGVTELHWRLRLIGKSPIHPRTPWTSRNENSPGERDLRFGVAADTDGDGVLDSIDNCPALANSSQANADGDAFGDACDPCPNDSGDDADLDGLCGDVDNCPNAANPGQEDADSDFVGDACDLVCPADPLNDADGDGLCGGVDNCPLAANPAQVDGDGDSFGDACDACPSDPLNDADVDGVCGNVDNCPSVANPGQTNTDGDALGDACDACPADSLNDTDTDGVCGDVDNCPTIGNASQANGDGDALGDACDSCPLDPLNDLDGDGACGDVDNCPGLANPSQANADGDSLGDACDLVCPNDPTNDVDGDGVCGQTDNCPAVVNPGQSNNDGDAFGNACDVCVNDPLNDLDTDGVCGEIDNCPTAANPTQTNTDGDSFGDACDACPLDGGNDLDGDGVCGNVDNCLVIANADQANADGDALGDACDLCALDPLNDRDADGRCANVDNCPNVANPLQEDLDVNGVGNVCECGDVDLTNVVDITDVVLVRRHIAQLAPDLTLPGVAKCSVIGGANDCDVLDATILRRTLAAPAQPPGIDRVCAAANPLP